MAATELATLCSFSSLHRRPIATKKAMDSAMFPNIYFSTMRTKRSFPIRASEPQREEEESSSLNNTAGPFTSQEDLDYLWKLGAGSVVGAAVIKYGSILFPEITRPNILQALIMISAPVIVAVLLLIKQSHVE